MFLDNIRSGMSGFFAKILLVLLVISFVVWGFSDSLKSGGQLKLAYVGGEPIKAIEIEKRLQEYIKFSGFQELDQNQLDFLKIQLLDAVIVNQLFYLEAKSFGLDLSDEYVVNELIFKDKKFEDKGKFSDLYFKTYLKNFGYTESEIIQRYKIDKLSQIFRDNIIVPYNTKVFDHNYLNKLAELRSVDIIVLSNEFKFSYTPTKEEMEKYYKDNQDIFRYSEAREVEFIAFTDDNKTDDFIKNKIKSFSKADLKALQDDLRTGSSMNEVAEKYSLKIYNATLNLKYNDVSEINSSEDMSKTLLSELTTAQENRNAILELPEETESELLADPIANIMYIAKIKKIYQPEAKPFEAVQKEIHENIYNIKKNEARDSIIQDIEKQIAEGKLFEEIKNPNVLYYKDVKLNRSLLAEALDERVKDMPASLSDQVFKKNINDVTDFVSSNTGNYYIAKLRSINSPSADDIENIKKKINTTLLTTDFLLEELAANLMKKYNVKYLKDLTNQIKED